MVEFRSLRPISTEELLDSRSMVSSRDSSTGASDATYPLPLPDKLSAGSLTTSATGGACLFDGLPLAPGCALSDTSSSVSITLHKSIYAALASRGISWISMANFAALLTRAAGADGATFSRLGRGIVVKLCASSRL